MKKETQSPGYVIDLSGKLRKRLTAAEQILWKNIKNKQPGFKFRSQHPVSRYILDFYCNEEIFIAKVPLWGI